MEKRNDIPESLRKRLRPSDWIAAQSIRLVAVLSLCTIFLILVFVVKEAMPVFSASARTLSEHAGQVQASPSQAQVPTGTQPEGYGEASAAPESYGSDNAPAPAVKADSAVASASAVADSNDPYGTPSAASVSPGEDPYGTPGASGQGVSGAEEVPAPKEFKFADLFSLRWDPVSTEQPMFGIWPLILGSLKVTLIALLFAAPVGILAALYTTTFAPKWTREFLKPVIEILAGIPSVVVGFFALMILASLLQGIFGGEYRLNSFVGGIGLAFTVIPIIYTLSEDAIKAVPKYLTEGSLALGATKWETNFLVVLPAATPGIFAALLLGLGRAFGETMIVLMATGNAAMIDMSLKTPVRTLSASIGAEMAEVVQGDLHYSVLFFLGVVLFLFSFALNAIAEFWVRERLMKRFKGI